LAKLRQQKPVLDNEWNINISSTKHKQQVCVATILMQAKHTEFW